MAAFLEDITPFLGDGSRNKAGDTLEEFLDKYNPNKYQNPSVTADNLVFKQKGNGKYSILMIKRKDHPSIGMWALPGGFVNIREDVIDAARRELEEETGIRDLPIQQLRAWGEYKRDPRTRIVTVCHIAIIPDGIEPTAGDDAAEAEFLDLDYRVIKKEIKNNRICETVKVKLEKKEKNIALSFVVEYSENLKNIIREPVYKVIEREGVAFDHPQMILDGIRFIVSQAERENTEAILV